MESGEPSAAPRRLPFDLAQLVDAFGSGSDEVAAYLDVEPLQEADRVEGGFGTRFIRIPQPEAREGYEDMEAFISTARGRGQRLPGDRHRGSRGLAARGAHPSLPTRSVRLRARLQRDRALRADAAVGTESHMTAVRWEGYPLVASTPTARAWRRSRRTGLAQIQADLGLASNTVVPMGAWSTPDSTRRTATAKGSQRL